MPTPLRYLIITLVALTGTVCATTGMATPTGPDARREQEAPPRLVVLVVVDQLRADLLDIYGPVFTRGFQRLREEGFRYVQATHDHANTLTAPGHATLVSGVLPSRHGVISNAWFEQGDAGWNTVQNVMDPEAPLVEPAEAMGASPRVLLSTTLGEWMQDAYGDARVVSVSAKARAAVLMAGKSTDAQVYWFQENLGRFVTSTHYQDAYPKWMTDFNNQVLPTLADTIWELSIPDDARSLARRDSVPYEGDGIHTTFPHLFSESAFLYDQGRFWTWWAGTPALDRATRLLAQQAAEAQELGTDEVPDLLAISFSQTDRVGHAYGPRSLEQLDNLHRLDAEVGELLDWLDAEVGEGEYVLLLTADHGVADIPEYAAEQGRKAYRLTQDSAMPLQGIMQEAAQNARGEMSRLVEGLAERLPQVSWIEQAWPVTQLQQPQPADADTFTLLHSRSVFPGRYAGLLGRQGVEMRLSPEVLFWSYVRGTTHGSPYMYDRHVPFILFGNGVAPGVSEEPVSANDVAPTLADYVGVPVPGDLDGVTRKRPGPGG